MDGCDLAEGVGFEPTVSCPTHAFQACRFGRSRIPPGNGDRRWPRYAPSADRARRGARGALYLKSTYGELNPLPRFGPPHDRSRTWRRGSGPAQRDPANRVRSGRKQLSAECPVCRRQAWPELRRISDRRRAQVDEGCTVRTSPVHCPTCGDPGVQAGSMSAILSTICHEPSSSCTTCGSVALVPVGSSSVKPSTCSHVPPPSFES